MKNLLSALLLTFGLGLATAQTTTPRAASTAPANTSKALAKKAEQQAKTGEAKIEKTAEVKLKKDGTPDKRYKAAKTLKKDGTPDKRYKVNK